MNIPKDKLMHFGASLGIELILVGVFRTWLPWQRFALNVGLFGCGKEIYDYRHSDEHDADWRDIVADALGALAGEIIVLVAHSIC